MTTNETEGPTAINVVTLAESKRPGPRKIRINATRVARLSPDLATVVHVAVERLSVNQEGPTRAEIYTIAFLDREGLVELRNLADEALIALDALSLSASGTKGTRRAR